MTGQEVKSLQMVTERHSEAEQLADLHCQNWKYETQSLNRTAESTDYFIVTKKLWAIQYLCE
jgi:hypothetical protein